MDPILGTSNASRMAYKPDTTATRPAPKSTANPVYGRDEEEPVRRYVGYLLVLGRMHSIGFRQTPDRRHRGSDAGVGAHGRSRHLKKFDEAFTEEGACREDKLDLNAKE